MITEDFCSFEVAKLLKEKGFGIEEETRGYYPIKGDALGRLMFGAEYHHNTSQVQISAPTHQMAMKWLRKEHNIFITIIPQEIKVGIDALCYGIYRITEDLYQPLYNRKVDNLVDSYEEAVEAALKYSLENLI